jgi:hypothetical protein
MKKYKIELDEKQMRLVASALDLYARVSIGQLDTVAEVPSLRGLLEKRFRDNWEGYDNYYDNPLVQKLKLAKVEMTGSANGNHGIFHQEVTDDARVACHIGDSIKYHLHQSDENPDKSKFVGSAYPASVVKGLEILIEDVVEKKSFDGESTVKNKEK